MENHRPARGPRPSAYTASAARPRPTVEPLEPRSLMSTVVAVAGRDTLLFLRPDPQGQAVETLGKIRVRGLAKGESLAGIDFFPSTGQLFALGDTSRLYRIDPTTGKAARVGLQPFAPALTGTRFGFDFDAATGVARVVSETDVNFRLRPDGAVVDYADNTPSTQTDLALNYAAGDPSAGGNPAVVALAHGSNTGGGAATAYGIDADTNALVRLGSAGGSPTAPSTGRLTTVGPIGVDATPTLGFDIAPGVAGGGEVGYAAVATAENAASALYFVNLTTGSATLQGTIRGSKTPIRDLAVAPDGEPVVLLDSNNRLTTVDTNLPNIPTSQVKLRGLAKGEKAIGLDAGPGGSLRAFTDQNRLYLVNRRTGEATAVGTPTDVRLNLKGATDFDVDPAGAAARVVTAAGENLRVNLSAGAVVDADPAQPGVQIDGPLVYASTDVSANRRPALAGLAHAPAANGGGAATLYAIDATTNALVTVGSVNGTTPPASGQLFTVGLMKVDFGAAAGFDVITRGPAGSGQRIAFAGFAPRGGKPGLYTVDLTTGAATLTGLLPKGVAPVGLTVIA